MCPLNDILHIQVNIILCVYCITQIIQQQYRHQASEYTPLNNHYGHDFIIVTALEYFATFNFCDFYRPAKFRKN